MNVVNGQESLLRKALKIAGGVGLILIGIVGLILPVMPGWVFIIPGLVILADYFPAVRRLVDWAKGHVEKHTRRPPTPERRDSEAIGVDGSDSRDRAGS